MKKIGSIKLGLLSLVAISGSVLANCPAPSTLHLDKSQKHWLANGGWRSLKPTQIKPGTQFVFFTAEATYHDGSYPPDRDTTYSFPLCSYHAVGSSPYDGLVVLKKTHGKPVKWSDLSGNWKPAIISPYAYMCRGSIAACHWV